jgi:hypothetical protein
MPRVIKWIDVPEYVLPCIIAGNYRMVTCSTLYYGGVVNIRGEYWAFWDENGHKAKAFKCRSEDHAINILLDTVKEYKDKIRNESK